MATKCYECTLSLPLSLSVGFLDTYSCHLHIQANQIEIPAPMRTFDVEEGGVWAMEMSKEKKVYKGEKEKKIIFLSKIVCLQVKGTH